MQTIKIFVKTNSSKSFIQGYDKEKDAVIVFVKSPPEAGKANIEVLKLFYRQYKQPVKILSGLTSKEKILRVG